MTDHKATPETPDPLLAECADAIRAGDKWASRFLALFGRYEDMVVCRDHWKTSYKDVRARLLEVERALQRAVDGGWLDDAPASVLAEAKAALRRLVTK